MPRPSSTASRATFARAAAAALAAAALLVTALAALAEPAAGQQAPREGGGEAPREGDRKPARDRGRDGRPANPCLERAKRRKLLCPDLQMSRPFGLVPDPFVRPGRVVLRAGNSINSIGRGPAELVGTRDSRLGMRARQRIYKRGGGWIGIDTGARLLFKAIPGQGHYWKFQWAARFELWRLDRRGRRARMVRRGPKVSYCLRDLDRTRPRLPRSPRRFVYPACNQSSATKRVRLGTSVGWSDVYPPGYHEQWIDVTGLRGCFDLVHTADPKDGIYESNERNNSAAAMVRLPFKTGVQRCPGRKPADPSGWGGFDPIAY